MRRNRDEWFPSVPLRLCVSKESHRTIRPSMRGRLETRRHRDHKANSLPSSPIPPSGEEWLRLWRRVATTMRRNRDEWFPSVLLRLRASAPLCFKSYPETHPSPIRVY